MFASNGVDISDVFDIIGQIVFHFVDNNTILVETFYSTTGIKNSNTPLYYDYRIDGNFLMIIAQGEIFHAEIENNKFNYSHDGGQAFFEKIDVNTLQPEITSTPITLSVGDTVKFDTWEVTLNSFRFTNRVDDGRWRFTPEEENTFAYVSITVENKDTQPRVFLQSYPLSTDINAQIVYDNTFVFRRTRLTAYSNCILSRSTNPLTSTTASIVFQVAERAANSDNSLVLRFFNGREEIVFMLR
jgi:hypothetical protein